MLICEGGTQEGQEVSSKADQVDSRDPATGPNPYREARSENRRGAHPEAAESFTVSDKRYEATYWRRAASERARDQYLNARLSVHQSNKQPNAKSSQNQDKLRTAFCVIDACREKDAKPKTIRFRSGIFDKHAANCSEQNEQSERHCRNCSTERSGYGGGYAIRKIELP